MNLPEKLAILHRLVVPPNQLSSRSLCLPLLALILLSLKTVKGSLVNDNDIDETCNKFCQEYRPDSTEEDGSYFISCNEARFTEDAECQSVCDTCTLTCNMGNHSCPIRTEASGRYYGGYHYGTYYRRRPYGGYYYSRGGSDLTYGQKWIIGGVFSFIFLLIVVGSGIGYYRRRHVGGIGVVGGVGGYGYYDEPILEAGLLGGYYHHPYGLGFDHYHHGGFIGDHWGYDYY